MLYHHQFQVKKGFATSFAMIELSSWLTDPYEIMDPNLGVTHIGGYSESRDFLEELQTAFKTSSSVAAVDWEMQWSAHAAGFQDGLTHMEYAGFPFFLKAGPGFGDLSHPSTQIVLELMQSKVKDKVVFDVGCGSGILSIAAAVAGAKIVYGIDIDPQALQHTKENAAMNSLNTKVVLSEKIDPNWVPSEPFLILMNMIELEQNQAWVSSYPLHDKRAEIIVSGLLNHQKESFLQIAESRGWALLKQKESGEWVGFVLLTT